MLFPEYFQELLGRCPSRGLGLLPHPTPPSEPTPSRSAGRESIPVLTKHLAGKKEVQLMVWAQFPGDPGLDGQSRLY